MAANPALRNSENARRPTRRSSSMSAERSSRKSPSWLTSITSPLRSRSARSVRWIAMSTTFSSGEPDRGTTR
jgi:hypothetical protein